MQPNFVFDPAPPQQIFPGPKAVDCRPPQPKRSEGHSSTSVRDSEAPASFESSLREAHRRERDVSRTDRAESRRDAAETRPESCREPKNGECADRSDAAESPPDGRRNSDRAADEKPEDTREQTSSQEGEQEEDATQLLSGAAAVPTEAGVPDAIPVEAGAPATGTVASAGGSAGSLSPDIADDLKIRPTEADPALPKAAAAGVKGPAVATAADRAPGTAASGLPDGTALPKSDSMDGIQTAGAGENGTDDSLRSLDDRIRPDAGSRKADKAVTGSQMGAGAAGSQKSDPADQAGDPGRLPKHLTADHKTSGRSAADTRSPSHEDGAGVRSGQTSTGQQGAGRVQGDLQQVRESVGRMDPGNADEAGPKLAKVSAGSKDMAFMHQQDQNFDRLVESNNATRAKEGPAGAWRAQTLDQIVNKAVYQLKNGLNSVRIDLKPEFLGQVRMQIVTVEQQVSVRITTELPMVKEMLVNHLQQLKADLQQQGLQVDEIEVSVSTDAQHNARNRRMPFEETPSANPSDGEDVPLDDVPAPERTAPTRSSIGTVDMFV